MAGNRPKGTPETPVEVDVYSVRDISTETPASGSTEAPAKTPALTEEDMKKMLASKEFIHQKQLRPESTSGGSLNIYKYEGTDPKFIKLFPDGMVLVKTKCTLDEGNNLYIKNAKITYDNECENIQQPETTETKSSPRANLGDLSSHNEDRDLRRPKLAVVQIDGHNFILNECIYFNKPNVDEMRNLDSYITSKGNLDAIISKSENDPEHRKKLVAKSSKVLDKLFISMVEAQDQLHEHGFLHLDTSCRNYCMTSPETVKIIDFGNSRPMGINETVELNYTRIPDSFFDHDALMSVQTDEDKKEEHTKKYKVSIETDLFARRMAMMETLARYMGCTTEKISELSFNNLPNIGSLSNPKAHDILPTIANNDRLDNMFHNLQGYAFYLLEKNNDLRGTVVLEQLEKYKKYLTAMPEIKGFKNIKEAEQSAFQTCSQSVQSKEVATSPNIPTPTGQHVVKKG